MGINSEDAVGKMMIRSNSLVTVGGWSFARGIYLQGKVPGNDAASQQL